MRLRWTGLRRPPVPPAARSAAGDDRVLGWATDTRTGALGLYEKVGMRVADTWVNRGIALTG